LFNDIILASQKSKYSL
jgi:hypothetical protein